MYTILKCTAPECPGHGEENRIVGACPGYRFGLHGANLSGADLHGAAGIVVAGPCRGRMMYGVHQADGMMVQAGCHWQSPTWLREHWKTMPERAEHVRLRLACLEALEVQARALGWGDVDRQPE